MDDLLSRLTPSRGLLADARKEARLDLAALAVAALEAPVDRASVEASLGALAARVRAAPGDGLEGLVQVLAREEGFQGDTERYDAPENSSLPRVLERKRGLPILLAVLYAEVARRAGLELHAVNFPGHVLVVAPGQGFPCVLDPFHGGRALDRAACGALLRRMAPHLVFHLGLLEPADVETLAARMLHNLRRSYLREQDLPRALGVVTLLLELMPDHPAELRLRASLLASLGAYRAALADLERCLELHPDCLDRPAVERAAEELRHRVSRLN
ncbi:MAG: tetratricopeptide repeat protein [Deltaproteobacteria bacterium]|nr:tetratricopeptide repeat protein [Deltaproteobacteria bacterium]